MLAYEYLQANPDILQSLLMELGMYEEERAGMEDDVPGSLQQISLAKLAELG